MQSDGNLVSQDILGKVLWSSATTGHGILVCVMQEDGNLLLIDANKRVVWATHTYGNTNAKLAIQDDGNPVVIDAKGLILWSKESLNTAIKNSLTRGGKLSVNEFLRSQNGKYTLRMQNNGNLVAYNSQGNALWNSNTTGRGATECVMQSDGNLLLFDKNGKAVWATNTAGHSNAILLVEDDGQVVLVKEGGVPFWSNGNMTKVIKPVDVPVEVRHQNDAGSGRDAGSVLGEAVPISPTTEPAEGELSPADNVDIYSIRLDQGWRLHVKLTNQSQQNYNLALLNLHGVVLESSGRGLGQSESIDFTAPASGPYYIRVLRKAGHGPYKIGLSIHKENGDDLSSYNANTGDNEFDDTLFELNNVANTNLDNFMNSLSKNFGISKTWIENLIKKEKVPPADVYMIARTASVLNRPIGTVEKNYLDNKGEGWGVIAKRLGIKPGSKEFHALKQGHTGFLSKGKSQGKKDKDKDKN